LLFKHHVGLLGHKLRYQKRAGSQDKYNQRDTNIQHNHESQGNEYGQNAGKELVKSHQKAICELIHIRYNTTHHITYRLFVDIGERQDLKMCKGSLTHVLNHTVGHLVIADIHQPLNQSCGKSDNCHLGQDGQ